MREVRKAVIPAAGMGTRFLPATKAIPKEMLPIVDKPTIQYVVEEAVACGIEDILFVTSQGKSAIEDHFDYDFELDVALRDKGKGELRQIVEHVSHMISVSSIRQKKPLGLGHAVLVTEPLIGNEPFSVFLGDDIIDHPVPAMQQMLNVFESHPGSIIAVQEVSDEAVSRYGVVDVVPASNDPTGRLFQVKDMIEKPSPDQAPSNLAIIGRYILAPGIFDSLRKTQPGAGGEIQLTDAIRGLIGRGEPVYAYRFEGSRYDAGDKLEFLIATVELALKREDLGPAFRKHLQSLQL